MSCTNISSETFRRILLTATAIGMFVGTHGALARGGGHSGDHGGMSGHALGGDNAMMDSHHAHADRDHAGTGSGFFRSLERKGPISSFARSMK